MVARLLGDSTKKTVVMILSTTDLAMTKADTLHMGMGTDSKVSTTDHSLLRRRQHGTLRHLAPQVLEWACLRRLLRPVIMAASLSQEWVRRLDSPVTVTRKPAGHIHPVRGRIMDPIHPRDAGEVIATAIELSTS